MSGIILSTSQIFFYLKLTKPVSSFHITLEEIRSLRDKVKMPKVLELIDGEVRIQIQMGQTKEINLEHTHSNLYFASVLTHFTRF